MTVSTVDFETFLHTGHDFLHPPEWQPCAQVGCCDGQAGCCRTGMATSITWLEAEAIWNFIQSHPETWTPERKQEVHKQAVAQALAAEKRAGVTDDTIALVDLKRIEQSLRDGEHSCPLLIGNGCGVYNNRPLICAGFGCSVIGGKRYQGCETAMQALYDYPDHAWPDYTPIERELLSLAQPRFNVNGEVMQIDLIAKPIPFWLAELGEGLENPWDIFGVIRNAIAGTIAQART